MLLLCGVVSTCCFQLCTLASNGPVHQMVAVLSREHKPRACGESSKTASCSFPCGTELRLILGLRQRPDKLAASSRLLHIFKTLQHFRGLMQSIRSTLVVYYTLLLAEMDAERNFRSHVLLLQPLLPAILIHGCVQRNELACCK